LRRAATAVTNTAIGVLRDSTGRVHSETAIVALAGTAGTLLLRETLGAQPDELQPGTPISLEAVDEQGMRLLQYLIGVAGRAGVAWGASGTPVPEENRPPEREVDLVRRLEPSVVRTLREEHLDKPLWPAACAVAALEVVIRTRDVLDTVIATRLLASALVAGAKTVPYPQ
jgi:hypothetical protein